MMRRTIFHFPLIAFLLSSTISARVPVITERLTGLPLPSEIGALVYSGQPKESLSPDVRHYWYGSRDVKLQITVQPGDYADTVSKRRDLMKFLSTFHAPAHAIPEQESVANRVPVLLLGIEIPARPKRPTKIVHLVAARSPYVLTAEFTVMRPVSDLVQAYIEPVVAWIRNQEGANKAPEPTPTSVTSPAAQEPRQP